MTQKQIILKILKENNDWVPSYDLVKRATKYGWIGTSGDRRARELTEMGLVERKEEGPYAYFRFKPSEPYQMRLI
jgi:hypothetical protein